MDWPSPLCLKFIAMRKTLEASMRNANMYPPGRVLWAMRDKDLHQAHQLYPSSKNSQTPAGQDKLRVFEVLDVEKVFSQLVFARNMLTWVSSPQALCKKKLNFMSQCSPSSSIWSGLTWPTIILAYFSFPSLNVFSTFNSEPIPMVSRQRASNEICITIPSSVFYFAVSQNHLYYYCNW